MYINTRVKLKVSTRFLKLQSLFCHIVALWLCLFLLTVFVCFDCDCQKLRKALNPNIVIYFCFIRCTDAVCDDTIHGCIGESLHPYYIIYGNPNYCDVQIFTEYSLLRLKPVSLIVKISNHLIQT